MQAIETQNQPRPQTVTELMRSLAQSLAGGSRARHLDRPHLRLVNPAPRHETEPLPLPLNLPAGERPRLISLCISAVDPEAQTVEITCTATSPGRRPLPVTLHRIRPGLIEDELATMIARFPDGGGEGRATCRVPLSALEPGDDLEARLEGRAVRSARVADNGEIAVQAVDCAGRPGQVAVSLANRGPRSSRLTRVAFQVEISGRWCNVERRFIQRLGLGESLTLFFDRDPRLQGRRGRILIEGSLVQPQGREWQFDIS